MARQTVNTGSALADRSGDNGRVAFTKVNENFVELYANHDITAAETAASVTPTNYGYPPGDVRRYGAVGDGSTNDRAALVAGDSVGPLTITSGTHAVSTSMTFTNRVTFEPGAKLKPASGVVITFTYFPEASPSEQIFDLSAALTGLAIVLPPSNDGGIVVPAAWFGAVPALAAVKSDQNVELQYAIDSVDRNDQGGGVIQLLYGAYHMTAGITIRNNITLRGAANRATSIRPGSSWGGGDTLITFHRAGDISMFNARLEDMMISGDGEADITRLIRARAWNEHCGLTRCLLRQFMQDAIHVTDYIGGPATMQLQSIEIFAHDDADAADRVGVRLDDPGFADGWTQFLVNHVVATGGANGLTDFTAIKADGRVRVINQGGLHAEQALAIVHLAGDARFEGVGPQATGNATVADIFSIAADWDTGAGLISCTPPAIGGATGLLINDAGDGANLGLSRTMNPLVYPLEKTYTGTTIAIDHARFRTHYLDTTAGAATVTLGDGHDGKEIFVLMTVDGGNATLNASTEGNFATVTFDNPGDWVLLRFAVGFGWYVIAGNATVA